MSLRRVLNKAQNNSCGINIANDFAKHANNIIKMPCVPLWKVIIIDETNTLFSCEGTRTYANISSRSVPTAEDDASGRDAAALSYLKTLCMIMQ